MSVLPCGYLYSMGGPASTSCRPLVGSLPHERCLQIWLHSCTRNNPLLTYGPERGGICRRTMQHIQARCMPTQTAVRALHFKGSHKPWLAASGKCESVRDGFMTTTPNASAVDRTTVQPLAPLEWSEDSKSCLEAASQQPLHWASGSRISRRECCTAAHAAAAHWFGLLAAPRSRVWRESRGWCTAGIWETPSQRTSKLFSRSANALSRWCCPRSCGTCRQEQGCSSRGDKQDRKLRRCCPRSLQNIALALHQNDTCATPAASGCRVLVIDPLGRADAE